MVKEEEEEGYREKAPPGVIWANPNKPEGYLGKSVLRSLARKVHDGNILLEELIEAGGFVDTGPPTGTEAAGKLAELELGIGMRRECKKTMEMDDESDDVEDNRRFFASLAVGESELQRESKLQRVSKCLNKTQSQHSELINSTIIACYPVLTAGIRGLMPFSALGRQARRPQLSSQAATAIERQLYPQLSNSRDCD
jgi:hypothetical protein